MERPFPIKTTLYAAWVLLCIGVWALVGWKLQAGTVWPSLLPEAPIDQLIALGRVALFASVATLAGGLGIRHLLSRSLPLPATACLGFLLALSLAGGLGGWVAFIGYGPHWFLVLLTLLVSAALAAWRQPPLPRPGRAPFRIETALRPEAILLAVALLLSVLAAMAPARESDGLRYHLVGPQEWLRAGSFVPIPYSANSNLPSLLGLFAGWFGGWPTLGLHFQLLHAFHLVALSVLAGAFAARLLRLGANRQTIRGRDDWRPVAVAAVVASTPVTAIVGAWPFSDVAGAAYWMGAVLALMPGVIRRGAARAILAGLLLGACLAAKLSMLPLAGLAGVWALWSGRRQFVRTAPLLMLSGALVLGPWLLKSFLYHGNPVYPVAYGLFGGPEWSASNDLFYKEKAAEKGMGRSLTALLLLPWNVTAHWERFEAQNPGPLVLVFLPLVVMAAWRAPRLIRWFILGLLLSFLVWFVSYQSVRFLIPQLAVIAAIGVVLTSRHTATPGSERLLRFAILALILSGLVWTTWYRTASTGVLPAALGRINRDAFIQSSFNAYGAIRWLDGETQPGEPVVYIGEHRAAHARSFRPVTSDWFDTPRVLVEIRETASNQELLARWRQSGVRYVLINQAELSLYEAFYFRPRFSDAEWLRFTALREELFSKVTFQAQPGIVIARITDDP